MCVERERVKRVVLCGICTGEVWIGWDWLLRCGIWRDLRVEVSLNTSRGLKCILPVVQLLTLNVIVLHNLVSLSTSCSGQMRMDARVSICFGKGN